MKRKLYANTKRMTSMFCVAIICVTLTSLMLRLTVFSDVAVAVAAEENVQVPQEDTSLFPYTISSKVSLESPQARGNFMISNPETNTNYMTVAIVLPETGENVLYTGFVKPGEARESAALHIPLPEGVYDCVAQVTAYDPQTLSPRGSEERPITLYIGEKVK